MQIELFKIKTFSTFLFLLLMAQSPFAQSSVNEESKAKATARGAKAIRDLKGGVLILRLESNENKIKKLEKLAGSDAIDGTTRRRLQRQASEEKELTKRNNMKLTYAFTHHYNFSEVLFMYDKSIKELKAGKQEGLFLDKDLNPAPELSLNDRPYLILYQGTSKTENTSGVEAYLIMDQEFKTLYKPFPYYIAMKNMGSFFDSFLGSKNITKKNAYKVAVKFNTRFKKFYAQYSY